MRLRRRATRTVQHVSVEVDIGTFSIELVLILNLIRLCLFKSPSDGFLNPIPNQVLLIPVFPHRVEKRKLMVVLVTGYAQVLSVQSSSRFSLWKDVCSRP